ncbi:MULTISPECIES: SusD/RagB family nutrient-binding outer membrane lipoprotein [unclassified Flavobacterium]|jgi:hypothetical protein|uniref:SusD/RagB family nutrient-binding outer membrane lipoprotein n=1 Tax=unclassified Flavobacterium TaxID=196869 RepID=UPI0025C0A818|nr:MULTISPECIES: SusD/RagB family nutrient-binding outer membrane lipoprotein [unclassified Flavobacterium]
MNTNSKHIGKGIMLLLMIAVLNSCTNFDQLAVNPNLATSVPPSMLLSGVISDVISDGAWNDTQRDNQFWVISFDYYGNQDYNWGEAGFKYKVLANVDAMEKEAQTLDSKNIYEGLGKFFKAYYFDYMSKRLGDIPMSEALKASGEPSIQQPKYDTQKDVYEQILTYLEESNDQIALARTQVGIASLHGDPLFKGDLQKWQKAINSFHLRVLISLSNRSSEMDVASRIKTILDNPGKYPLMGGLDDNMERRYGNEQNNYYPFNPGNYGFNRNRNIIGATYLNLLKDNNDPRIYKVADPASALYNSNDPLNLNAYVGANTGDAQGPMQVASDNGMLSYPNEARYYKGYDGEPYIIIGYAEQEFTIAEAINRGYVTGDAKMHYENGIKASMGFYNVSVEDVNVFLAQGNVNYAGNNIQGLQQIIKQKYIAFFDNSGHEAYFNYRRTQLPVFNVGAANNNGGLIPLRWKYPQSEFQNNSANVNEALSRQYQGTDDINKKMWILN